MGWTRAGRTGTACCSRATGQCHVLPSLRAHLVEGPFHAFNTSKDHTTSGPLHVLGPLCGVLSLSSSLGWLPDHPSV